MTAARFTCAGCDSRVRPGDVGAKYSGRTGFVMCARCADHGVAFTRDLASALLGEREWTQADEQHSLKRGRIAR